MKSFCNSALCFLLLLASGGLTRAEGDTVASAQLREETFQAVWEQVNAGYYDPGFGGRDWAAIGARYRARLPGVTDEHALRSLIKEMLFELGESHIGILSSDYDPSSGEAGWGGGAAGLDLCYDDAQLIVYRLDKDGPAYRSGVRNGDAVLAVGGDSVTDLRGRMEATGMAEHLIAYSTLQLVKSRFQTAPGDLVSVEVESADGERKAVTVELAEYQGAMTQRFGNLGEMPLTLEIETLEGGVAYLRFNLWFPAAMLDIRKMVTGLSTDTPGLIIDLRGNAGGIGLMASGLAGLLVEDQINLGTTTLREGHINFVAFPQKDAFLGPVAVLVDEASCSTSEVFAIGLQEAGRIRVFGQPTPGAALPSVVTKLPNGDYLQLALGDFKTPEGTSLEGVGVTPETIVSISSVDLSKGTDTVLRAAQSWILNSD